MAKVKQDAEEMIGILFLIFMGLFGILILTFIFSQLGNVNSNIIADATETTVNETNAFLNQTPYVLKRPLESNFTGGVVLSAAYNGTDQGAAGNYNITIPLANITLNTVTNTISSADYEYNSSNISISYSSSHKTGVEVVIDTVNNNSLAAAQNYSTQSGTQATTIGIAITLLVLLGLFGIFMAYFRGKKAGMGNAANFG